MPRKEKAPLSVGDRFNRLVITEKLENLKNKCICDCGKTIIVRKDHLVAEMVKSCGCLRSEKSSSRAPNLHKMNTTHGLSKSRADIILNGVKQRCLNPNNSAYKYYGGRGIKICNRWIESVENFVEDMGHPPKNMTLERIDNNIEYCKSNCRWASRKEQMNNTRANRVFTYNGETLNITQWSEKFKIHRNTLNERINNGWSIEQALTLPLVKKGHKRSE